MATVNHLILKVNDLDASVAFYASVLACVLNRQPPLSSGWVPALSSSLRPGARPGREHYAFAVSRAEFERIFSQLKAAGIAYGPTFDSVGSDSRPGQESGTRGLAPTIYFNDPNQHLLEIRTYED